MPGLYKIFDEILVNTRDQTIRDSTCKTIKIKIDKENGLIEVWNDGNGIDVAQHPEYKIWIPEMIFGHLRTSTNYNKEEKKIIGGKNGFGFKLVLIYAKWGEIETIDHIRKKKYTQRFEDNLGKICKPKVTKSTAKPYTKVSWLPDYERFGLEGLSSDMFQMFKKFLRAVKSY